MQKIFVFAEVLFLILLISCGGYNDQLLSRRKPRLRPLNWLSGEFLGRKVIFDRNGNIKETAYIRRKCRAIDDTRGNCREEIKYYYHYGNKKNEIEWAIIYHDKNKMDISIRDLFGELTGSVHGSVMLLEGRRLIPGSNDKKAAVKTQYQLLPGMEVSLLQRDVYSFLGIKIGTEETFWRKK